MGFYKPGKSSNYHICIWYKKVSTQTIVWVANRDIPISDKYSSELKILDGNLVLLNESQTPIWSTNQNSTTSNSVVAVLGDDGNLILRDGSNSTQPIWQSFDYLVHTWLPGSKISYNKRANTHQSLTSWRNSEDPSPGLFSHILDANNSYVLLWNGSKQYWTSGPWNGEIFSLLPTTRQNYMFNISFVDNENESYLKYSPYDPYIISRVVMDVLGQLKQLTWLEGSKEWNLFWGSAGTAMQRLCFMRTIWNLQSEYTTLLRTKLQCGNASAANQEKDRFQEYSNMRLPEHPQSVASGSATECESSCLENCSCTAYAYDRNGCSIWTMHLVNLQQLLGNDSSGSSLYLRLAASEFSRDNNMGIIIGVVGSVVVLGFVYVMWKQQRRLIATPCVLFAKHLLVELSRKRSNSCSLWFIGCI
ncbi:hypothetical protein ACSBR1_012382 [Camellia fascicularis]